MAAGRVLNFCVSPSPSNPADSHPEASSTTSFELEIPLELFERSEVLRTAASGDAGSQSRLVLPPGADCSFFDAWIALVKSQTADDDSHTKKMPLDAVLSGLRVRSLPFLSSCSFSA